MTTILEGTLMSHLLTSKQECTRHVGICRIFRDLGGPGFSHNSFHSLNTLTSGNSSLYLTSRPPPAVNTHFRFLLSPVGMENSWPTSSVYSLSAIVPESRGYPQPLLPTSSTKSESLFSLFSFVARASLFVPSTYAIT